MVQLFLFVVAMLLLCCCYAGNNGDFLVEMQFLWHLQVLRTGCCVVSSLLLVACCCQCPSLLRGAALVALGLFCVRFLTVDVLLLWCFYAAAFVAILLLWGSCCYVVVAVLLLWCFYVFDCVAMVLLCSRSGCCGYPR